MLRGGWGRGGRGKGRRGRVGARRGGARGRGTVGKRVPRGVIRGAIKEVKRDSGRRVVQREAHIIQRVKRLGGRK